MTTPALGSSALVVHLFVAVDGTHRDADHEYLRKVWRVCDTALGMTQPITVTGLSVEPLGWDGPAGQSGVLAARTRPGPGVHQAVLRREHDTFCLTVMREPAPEDGVSWAELDRQWSEAIDEETIGGASTGVIGVARLFLARLVDPAATPAPDAALAEAVRGAPLADAEAGTWERGVRVAEGFAVWEASDRADDRVARRIVVVAAADCDAELSAWTWTRGDQEMTPFAKYLLHAAKLRYQLRVWGDGQGFRQLRRETDDTVRTLLSMVLTSAQRQRPLNQVELLDASAQLVSLQARELGLVQRASSLREMRRTVDIAASNLVALTGDTQLKGLFADDRALAGWFAQQLDDDATYLEAARDRAREVGAFIDQLVRRGQQQRQERFNLGLTGLIGAIVMSLAAIQSLQYPVPLPGPVKPAVVTALGTLALFVSLVVLRLAVPERRWPLALAQIGFGLTAAALTWVGVSTVAGVGVAPGWTWVWSSGGFLAGVTAAVIARRFQR